MLSARQGDDTCVLIEVQDECGGIPEGASDPFKPFGERRGRDRPGLGLGLSIARKAVRAHGGDIRHPQHARQGLYLLPSNPVERRTSRQARRSPPSAVVPPVHDRGDSCQVVYQSCRTTLRSERSIGLPSSPR